VIAFWAFFSVFPLLLIFVALLGYFLPPNLQGDVLRSAASFFPLLSTDSIGRLSGQWWTLVVGILSAVWSGSFVVIAIQSAFNSVWEIPHAQRPSIGAQIKRGLFALGAIALGLVVSTVISSYLTATATGTSLGVVAHLAGYLIAVALDVGLFIVTFRLLTDRDVSTHDVLPGALLSGIVFWLLQQLSSLIIFRYLHNAERDLRQLRHRHHHVDVVLLAKRRHLGRCAAQRGTQGTATPPPTDPRPRHRSRSSSLRRLRQGTHLPPRPTSPHRGPAI
jgi:uncharacterized BrkB/YihY/UPF0761 family membrane protein